MPVIAPHTPLPIDQVYADHFYNGEAYATFRPKGGGDWLLIYTLRGVGRIIGEGGVVAPAGPGSYVLYGPTGYQDYSTDPSTKHWEMLWAHFQPTAEMSSRIARLRIRETAIWTGSTQDPEVREGMEGSMRRVVEESRSVRHFGQHLALNALEAAFIWIEAMQRIGGGAAVDDRIWKATRLLAEESALPLRVADLAARCGLSTSRFAHLFREQTGLSPMRFVERERLRRASNLLRATSLTVAEVATRVGFDDPLYFSRRFKKEMGQGPRAWRSSPPRGVVDE